ncbi:MAG: HU family DNA-binding protein, partial [Ignavibacteria bacterium]
MLKQEITEKISKFFKVTEFEAEKIFDDIFAKIIDGVKDDNIVDVVNFGEFIVKYDNGKNTVAGMPYKKTIEFLASVNLEDEIGYKSYDVYKSPASQTTGPVTEPTPVIPDSTVKSIPADEIKQEKITPVESKISEPDYSISPVISDLKSETEHEKTEEKKNIPDVNEVYSGSSSGSSSGSAHEDSDPVNIEEDFKKKREALLNKISIHPLQDSTHDRPEQEIKASKPEEFHYFIKEQEEQQIKPETELMTEHTEEINKDTGEIKETKKEEIPVPPAAEEKKDTIPESVKETVKSYYGEDLSSKSFSDYFTEVGKDEQTAPVSSVKEDEKQPESVLPLPPIPQVIPQKAVELHKEITSAGEKSSEPASTVTVPTVTAPTVTAPTVT